MTMADENPQTKIKKLKADQLARENRLEEAKALYVEVCRMDPLDVEAWINVSAINRRLNHFQEAEACATEAVSLQPELALSHYALATAVHSQGRMEEALAGYRRTIQLNPDFARAHYLLGNVSHSMGLMDDALTSYRQAIALQPNFFEALNNLGAVLTGLGLLDEATKVLQQVLTLRPDAPQALTNLACVAEQAGRIDESLMLFQRALRIAPDAIEVLARLAASLEKLGRLEEAKTYIERGLAMNPTYPMLALAAARMARREGRTQDAVNVLEAADARGLDQGILGEIQLLLGQLYDKLGDSERAFPLFVEGKRHLALASQSGDVDTNHFLEKIEANSRYLTDRLVESALDEDGAANEAPIFLVGFPRSGTTLLEQILDCHPALQALEEKPAVEVMEHVFLGWAQDRENALADLGPEQILHLQRMYFAEVARHIQRLPGAALVDKFPLNIVQIPLIWRVFPHARFILALRHPCDVCLSCLMQSFSVNEAMASFFTLENTARTYAGVMGLWQDFERKLPLRYHRIRYEDLVVDLEGQTRALLDFLGVGWDDAVLSHVEHAKQRKVIDTPSYHQVTQPIYQHAKYRWKRYAREFDSVMPILQSYIEDFGYAE
jgi:tetratricopeptide (TPR) repeat protein